MKHGSAASQKGKNSKPVRLSRKRSAAVAELRRDSSAKGRGPSNGKGDRSNSARRGVRPAVPRPTLDPVTMKDWQIAEAAEEFMIPIGRLAQDFGLKEDELIPMGPQLAKVDGAKALRRLQGNPAGKYIDVTAITPTPLGEGKTTTVIGLVEGLGQLGLRVTGAIRQPSGGPTFNIKGSAAGGGLAQCLPLVPFSRFFPRFLEMRRSGGSWKHVFYRKSLKDRL